jgi:hypothetical protein
LMATKKYIVRSTGSDTRCVMLLAPASNNKEITPYANSKSAALFSNTNSF